MTAKKERYCQRMARSPVMHDKTFFYDIISFDTLVDFGCADGSILKELRELGWQGTYYGYDYDQDMVQRANNAGMVDAHFYHEWKELREILIPQVNKKIVILFSSLLHELPETNKSEWEFAQWTSTTLRDIPYSYIVIRDMGIYDYAKYDQAWLESAKVAAITKMPDKANQLLSPPERKNFIDPKELFHFFLCYRYNENWKKESAEQYLTLSIESMLNGMKYRGNLIHFRHFVHEYTKKCVERDFGILFNAKTHYEAIFERRR